MSTISLSGKWSLSDGKLTVEGNVPGDVTNDLLQAGKISNPYVGYNYEDCLWIQAKPWTYSRTFTVEEETLRSHVRLVLKGVDTYSEIFINGKRIGKTESMHLEYRFPLEDILKVGENEIVIKMLPVYDFMPKEPQQRYDSVFNANRIFLRKAQCHFGWDWAPKFPGYGIYRDVLLETYGDISVEEVKIVTRLSGEVNFFMTFTDEAKCNLDLRVFDGEREVARAAAYVGDHKKLFNVRIPSPKLWWPNGYGEQPLYTYQIRLEKDGVVLQQVSGRFGIREIGLDKSMIDAENSRFAFVVNGVKIYARGSNWIPADLMTGTLTRERYDELLLAAKEANYNMLRVWGGGIYESDDFYELCDRYGILIWQDFMFACQEVPDDVPELEEIFKNEAIFQVKRLRNHPCIAYWCGINETRSSFNRLPIRYGAFFLNVTLRGICENYDGTRPYEASSPVGFAEIENDVCYGDAHNNVSETFLFGTSFKGFEEFDYGERDSEEALALRIENYYRFLEETKNNFSSECAVIGACSYESLKKFLPGEEDLPLDDPFFQERFLGNPYTHVMPSFIERQTVIAKTLYGELRGLEDFTVKCNQSQADIITAEIGYARSNGRSAGFMNWMYNDIWPTGTWSVIDYYKQKKPAYYAMKRCFQPILKQFVRLSDSLELCIVNDSTSDFAATVEYGAKKFNGEVVVKKTADVTVQQGEKLALDSRFEGHEYDYLYATVKTDEKTERVTYNTKLLKNCHYDPVLIVEEKETEEGLVVTLQAKTYVPCVEICTDGMIEDNYFDLDAGEVKQLLIRGMGVNHVVVKHFLGRQ